MATPRRVKVLFVTVGGWDDPSSRVRAFQFMPHLRPAIAAAVRGVSIGACHRWPARLRQARALVWARWADVVVVQKVGSAKLIDGLMRVNRRVLFDTDDEIYPDLFDVLPRFERVLVGNPTLAGVVAPHNPAVTLLPSVVDEHRFRRRAPPRAAADPVVVGWIGSTPNLRYLETVRPAFEALARSRPNRWVLKVVSGGPLHWPGVPIVNKRWSLADEPADVESFDVGIMPLLDDAYSRQKCGYKALLSMAMAEPVVLSPVGVNADLVVDGVHGFHATMSDQWHDRLARLIDDADLRLAQGLAGSGKVAREFSVASTLSTWATVLSAEAARAAV